MPEQPEPVLSLSLQVMDNGETGIGWILRHKTK